MSETQEQGKTTISDAVVAKIAKLVAEEVEGIHELVSQGIGDTISGLTQRVTGSGAGGPGVHVEVGTRETAIDLQATVVYGAEIAKVAAEVRRNVAKHVQAMTGLVVKEVNIDIVDLYFPGDENKKKKTSVPRVE